MSTENLPPSEPGAYPASGRFQAPPPDEAASTASLSPPAPPGRAEVPAPSNQPRPVGLRGGEGRLRGCLRRVDWRIGGLVLVIGLSILVWCTVSARARTRPASAPTTEAVPVPVARVTRQDLYNEVTIPAEFRPYVDVELHAKVSGYVKDMHVDFGDRVKAGQLLATIEVPELKDQLNEAMATQRRAEADYVDAHLVYGRLNAVIKDHPDLVAQQEIDNAEAKDHSTAAAIGEAKAEVGKYHTLLAYTQITAPFDGVITWRYVDPGALIQAGTSSETQSLPLVRVSDNYRLRLDFPVTVDYVKDIHLDDPVAVRVDSLNGKAFTGTISRFTDDVNQDTRTMTTEIEVANPNLQLVPGMYAAVVLKVEKRPQTLAVPIEAVVGDKAPVVYVVNQDNQIEERPVKLGLETPDKYEVLSGLHEGDLVVIGNGSKLQAGQKVEPKLIQISMRNEN